MFEIIPGILEKDWEEIERKINLVKSFAKSVHIDIIDGKFAPASPASPRGERQGGPNATFLDPKPFKKFTNEMFFEVHMMVDNPIEYLKPFASAGFRRFLGHIEKMPDQEAFVAQGQLLGEVGLAVDGPTQLSAIKVAYSDLDCVLIMTIKAGESGRTFVPEYLKKVEILRGVYPERSRRAQNDIGIPIEVDGGINSETIVQAKNAGAARFVANSFIFERTNPETQFNLLKKW